MTVSPHFRTRFAPSPTGRLHLGHAASARTVWQMAEKIGAETLLRIEDIDTTRCRPDYTEAIYEDLNWLGFDWPQPVRVQSDHFADYDAVVQDLRGRGLAYRCFRTRTEIADLTPKRGPFTGSPLKPSEEQALLDRNAPYAWRLSLSACREALGPVYDELCYSLYAPDGLALCRAAPALHGDIVIARKDSPSAYHIAATHDDALQGITHVIRGEDLADAPHIQTLLQVLMDWPPPVYHHHPLVMGPDGRRLAKSHGSLSLAELRANGHTPFEIWAMIGS